MGFGVSVVNNLMAKQVQASLDKSGKAREKSLQHLGLGEKIASAGEGPSEYAISEKMRVLMRSLGQDEKNVQTGNSLLHVAEGGIQQQLELLRDVKAKVLAADNDTVTDADRKVIQSEVNERYQQIEDIADAANYNQRYLLHGGNLHAKVVDWISLTHPVLAEGSDSLGLIADRYPSLDGQPGPFDAFQEYAENNLAIDTLSIPAGGVNFSGGTAGDAKIWTFDLSSYDGLHMPDALKDTGFSIETPQTGTAYYVLSTDLSHAYKNAAHTIDISGCGTVEDVVAKIAAGSYPGVSVQVGTPATKVQFTSNEKAAEAHYCETAPWHSSAETVNTPGRPACPPTGLFPTQTHFTGGRDASGVAGDVDNPYKPAGPASLVKDISSVPTGSGITVHMGAPSYVKFVAGSGETYDSAAQVYEVGKDFNGAFSLGDASFKMSNGVMTITSYSAGSSTNNYSVSDGVPAVPASSVTYAAVTDLSGTQSVLQAGADGNRAHYDVDLSSYMTSDASTMEAFIRSLAGKAVSSGSDYEFFDSTSTGLDGIQKIYAADRIDLNGIRTAVAGGKNITEAFVDLLQGRMGSGGVKPVQAGNGSTTGVSFLAPDIALAGNSEQLRGKEGQPRSYTIDFASWLARPDVQAKAESAGSLAKLLDGKGFRAYCATCNNQWFNFSFVDGSEGDADKPKSGTAAADIKSLLIDVSGVTDAASLAKAVYEQTMPSLTGTDPSYNHFMRLAANGADGMLTLYDNRLYPVSSYPNYQTQGAKIADGVYDNIVRSERNVYVQRIIIQHTDKSDDNIQLDIPRTTLDHILGYNPDTHDIAEYSVLTRTMRDKLLGQGKDATGKAKAGVLDQGIQYLTDANTLLGAQMNHLDAARTNIVTENTNIQAADSRLRDANVASEMAAYTKYNVLAQAAQFMLAQANQSPEAILRLLQ